MWQMWAAQRFASPTACKSHGGGKVPFLNRDGPWLRRLRGDESGPPRRELEHFCHIDQVGQV